jgi:hypothetical protein
MMATVTCQNCGAEVEIPVPEHKPRGVLAGKTLEEMSFDELKIERRMQNQYYINLRKQAFLVIVGAKDGTCRCSAC